MNTSSILILIKRIAAVTAGIVLLSLCGQSVASAYQYPALTSHHKYRIFVTHKSASKAPVVAALRALPAKSSKPSANVLGTIDVYPGLVSPATLPTDINSNPYITYGATTPTYAPQYTLPPHVVLTPTPLCSVVAGPGTLNVGTYTVDCLNGPASVTYDETGTQVDYTVVYHSSILDVMPASRTLSITNTATSATAGGLVGIPVTTSASAGSGAVSIALDPTYSNTNCSISSLAVNASAPATCYVIATIAADSNYNAASSTSVAFTFTAAPTPPAVTHHVTYSLGGGSGTAPIQADVAENQTFMLASSSGFSYAGHTFNKWSDGTNLYPASVSYGMGTSDVVLTATWTTNSTPPSSGPINYVSHTVSYNLAGGNGSVPASVTVVVGSGFTVASAYGLSKDGYTFGGWTDGAHVYAAGSLQYIGNSDIVLTAIWNSTSDGSGGAAPIVLPKTPVTQPVAQVFTNHSVASNLVANFAKIVDITFKTTVVPVPHDAGTSIRLTDGVQASLADQLNLALTSAGVQVTAVKGWTGRISFPVVATQSGKDVELFVGVEEDPAPVLAPAFSLLTTNQAKISWTVNNSQVELYNVYLGNSLACTTSKNTCTLPIKSIANFKSSLKIESVGHQATYSTRVAPAYSVKSLVSAGIVHFNVGSAALTNTAKKTMATLVSLLKALGVTNVNLNGHADATGLDAVNKQLSIARANAVKVYLSKALPKLKFNGKGFSSTVPVNSNSTAAGRSDNRRVEVLVG